MDPSLILVVDDNETARYAKSRVLRRAGFEVIDAATGEEALQQIAERKPRLVVLDVQLPDIDGWTLCRRLKEDPETASILVLQVSATFVSEQDTVRALEGGADGCLTEPLEGPVLVATVQALLRAREAENALREALEREQAARGAAEAANRTKDEFLALLSHELRTPLGTILTWVTLLREGSIEPDLAERGLEAIERNTRVQVKLIEDLLDVSRIITGKTRLEVGRVDLAAVVETALESVRPAAVAKGVRLDVFVAPGAHAVLGDAMRLQQVIWNLLENAVKFTPKGGWIETRVERGEDQAVVQVSDSGKGIETAVLPHVFERFRQADSSMTRTEGGLGLGLAIVDHMVELHGGTVEVRSAGLGQGTTFTVRLPRALLLDDAVPATVGEPVAARIEAISRALDGLRVLVVDDQLDAREAVAAVLESAGARVHVAGSVQAALGVLDEAAAIDAVVSDIAMPQQDGFALIRTLRGRDDEAARRMPALALTAHAGEPEGDRIREAGFDAYLAKPIEAAKLIAAVARVALRGD